MFSANDVSNGINVTMAYNQSSMKITFAAQSTVIRFFIKRNGVNMQQQHVIRNLYIYVRIKDYIFSDTYWKTKLAHFPQ